MATVLATLGPFDVIEEVGAGGMADVFRGVHRARGTQVAVKVIRGRRGSDPEYRDKFRREVQAVAGLTHPGVVRVYDYGTVSENVDEVFAVGNPYLVMELAPRGALRSSMLTAWSDVRAILLQLLDALAYSHARGVIHRDIKPANILLFDGPHGSAAKLTDFGIAHSVQPMDTTDQQTAAHSEGTPSYMPPEQLQVHWRDYGPWTDLYALGVSAWQLLTGRLPFEGRTPWQILVAHMQKEPPEFEPRFDVPAELEGWLRRLLAKAPLDRFTSAADAAWVLSELGNPEAGSASLTDSQQLVETAGPDSDTLFLAPTTLTTLPFVPQAPSVQAQPRQTGLIARAVPPMPTAWRTHRAPDDSNIVGVGLGLFGLREVPFVDRDEPRERVWRALNATRDGGPKAVLLVGAAGAGKTRTAQWLTRRALEVGAAHVLSAFHAPILGPSHGIGAMLGREFVEHDLDRGELLLRVKARLARCWPEAEAEFVDIEARALTELIRPASENEDELYRFSGVGEQYVVVARFVNRLSRERPVVVLLDDIQWGGAAMGFAEHVLDHADPRRVLLLMTARAQVLRDNPAVGERVRALASHENAETIELGPLEAGHHRELVSRVLGLEEPLVDQVAQATEGNPLFAVQLIGDWVERGVLEAGARGYTIRSDSAVSVPGSIGELWLGRIDRILAQYGGEAAPHADALDIAAILGTDVDADEWEAACAALGASPPFVLVDALVEQGMAFHRETGWSFVHEMLASTIASRLGESARTSRLYVACASMIDSVYGPDPRHAARRADYYVRGNQLEPALASLEGACEYSLEAGDLLEAERLAARLTAVVSRLGLAADDLRVARAELLLARVERQAGKTQESRTRLDEVTRLAERQGWTREQAVSLRETGELMAQAGRLDEAQALYSRAELLLRSVGSTQELAKVLESRSWAHKAKGETVEATRLLDDVLQLYRDAGNRNGEANVLNRIAFTFLAAGDYDAARETCEIGIDRARSIGNRGAEGGFWTTIGEIDRFEGDFNAARHAYREGARLDELCGSKHVWLVRLNAVLAEIGDGRHAEARAALDEIAPRLGAIGFGWLNPFVGMARVAIAAGLGEWSDVPSLIEDAVTELTAAGLVERDTAWLAELTGDLAAEAGRAELARAAWAIAVDQWTKLGEAKLARNVEKKAAVV